MFCRFCGKEIEDNSKFCNYCGNKLEVDDIEIIKPNNNACSDNTYNTSKNINENSGRGKGLLITIGVILIAFLTIFTIVKLN